MSRRRDNWEDEDDRPRRRRDWDDEEYDQRRRRPTKSGGLSTTAIILMIVGGVFFVVAIGGVLVYRALERKHDVQDRAAAEIEKNRLDFDLRLAREAARRQANAIPRPGDPPPPKPGFGPSGEPPLQPDPSKFDKGDDTRRWRVLFRGKDPANWNTHQDGEGDFAIPLQSTLEQTKFLRLRRMDSGESMIIRMDRGRIGRTDSVGPAVRWNGEGKEEYGAYHLGIAEGPVARFNEGKGTIGVLMDGASANPGSGFGHAHHVEGGGQRYSWLGKEINATAFEIAVTTEDLTDEERRLLR